MRVEGRGVGGDARTRGRCAVTSRIEKKGTHTHKHVAFAPLPLGSQGAVHQDIGHHTRRYVRTGGANPGAGHATGPATGAEAAGHPALGPSISTAKRKMEKRLAKRKEKTWLEVPW